MERSRLGGRGGWEVRPTRDIAREWWTLPEVKGIYGVLFPEAARLLSECGYPEFTRRRPVEISGHALLCIGSTTRLNLQTRITHHVFGDSRLSSLRRTLGVLFGREAGLRPYGSPGRPNFHFGEGELWLTEFIAAHTLFAFRPSSAPACEENGLIKRHRPPFNIKGLEHTAFARHVSGLRQAMAAEVQCGG